MSSSIQNNVFFDQEKNHIVINDCSYGYKTRKKANSNGLHIASYLTILTSQLNAENPLFDSKKNKIRKIHLTKQANRLTHCRVYTKDSITNKKTFHQFILNIIDPSNEETQESFSHTLTPIKERTTFKTAIKTIKWIFARLFCQKEKSAKIDHLQAEELRDILSTAPRKILKNVRKSLSLIKHDEKKILSFINKIDHFFELPENMTRETLIQEIMNGAHVHLADDREYYFNWKETLKSQTDRDNSSSHQSDDPQFSIQGHVIPEFLCLTKVDQELQQVTSSYTRFQVEKNPVGVKHIIPHLVDWFWYKMSGNQQGPHGESRYTDSDPIILQKRQITVLSISNQEFHKNHSFRITNG